VEFTPQNYKVSALIERIESGEMALPEFQRKFLWQPAAIADLLRTVARQWPAGTFLVLEVEGEPEFATKPLQGAPPVASPKILILDGQQRSTALYQALTERAGETYFVDMGQLREAGAFEDDQLRFRKNTTFMKEYPNVEAMAEARIIKVAALYDDMSFIQWTRYLPAEEQDEMLRIRQEHLPGFRAYEIPAVRLPPTVPLAAIAKIFETLNRTGMRLATFDLMVARLYAYDFKLRDAWEEARASHRQFDDLGIEDGVEVLKVIALGQYMQEREANIKRTVKGIRESDVLALTPQVVIDRWEDAVQALAAAIQFVQDACGVVRKGLMPSSTMLMPLAHVLAPGKPRRDRFEGDLARWFWATSFEQTYAQAANTQAVSDTPTLVAWQNDQRAEPDVLRLFKPNADQLLDGRRRNEMLVRGILSRTVMRDARDWIDDKRFQDLEGKIELHHVIPSEFLEKHWDGDDDPVVNFAALGESTNKKLRNSLPKDVLQRPDISLEAIRSHGIDTSTLEETPETSQDAKAYITRFFEHRRDQLVALICEAVGIPGGAPSSASNKKKARAT
jgi:hypothetical protein